MSCECDLRVLSHCSHRVVSRIRPTSEVLIVWTTVSSGSPLMLLVLYASLSFNHANAGITYRRKVGSHTLGALRNCRTSRFPSDSRTKTNPQVSHRGTFTISKERNRSSAIAHIRHRDCAPLQDHTSEGQRLIRADNPTQWPSSTTSRFRRTISTRTGELHWSIGHVKALC